MKWGDDVSWLKDLRVLTLSGGCLIAGFLAGLLIFGSPWHLPPNWGDIPTWLLATLAAVGGWVALLQLRMLRQQIADEAARNVKRDELLDKQLAAAEIRAASERRRQAEDIRVHFIRSTGYVENDSGRPISDVTCKVMSKVDRHSLATPSKSGAVEPGAGGQGWTFLPGAKPVPRFEILRPGARCGFAFQGLVPEPALALLLSIGASVAHLHTRQIRCLVSGPLISSPVLPFRVAPGIRCRSASVFPAGCA